MPMRTARKAGAAAGNARITGVVRTLRGPHGRSVQLGCSSGGLGCLLAVSRRSRSPLMPMPAPAGYARLLLVPLLVAVGCGEPVAGLMFDAGTGLVDAGATADAGPGADAGTTQDA